MSPLYAAKVCQLFCNTRYICISTYLRIYISTYLRIYISTQVDTRRELEREVRLLQSRPSHAYSKHSPRNWSQDNLLGN